MSAKLVLLLMVAYVCVYYSTARKALSKIKDEDPEYYEHTGATGGIGLENSTAIGRFLFDNGLPKKFYTRKLKIKIWIARLLLISTPLMLATLLLIE